MYENARNNNIVWKMVVVLVVQGDTDSDSGDEAAGWGKSSNWSGYYMLRADGTTTQPQANLSTLGRKNKETTN